MSLICFLLSSLLLPPLCVLSLDTLDPLKFELIARRRGHEKVLSALYQTLAAAQNGSPLRSVKLNCVVMKGINDDELSAFVQITEEHDLEV
jgi:molybdenum cofactor biosynthesis enzyme MoaA